MNSEAELFDAYYRQELSAAEAQAFEQSLNQDKEMAARYQQFTYLTAGIQYHNRLQLLNKIKLTDAEQVNQREGKQQKNTESEPGREVSLNPTMPLYKQYWLLAAAVCLLIVLSAVVYLLLDNSSPPPLYASHYKPFTALEISRPRGASDLYDKKLEAQEAYEQGNYEKSLQLLQEAASLEDAAVLETDAEFYFMLGLNQLALNSAREAELSFTQALSQRYLNEQDVQWYLSLAYLLQNKEQEAATVLRELANRPGPWQQQSLEILQSLEQE